MAMNKPAIDNICTKVDSRYTLVVESAKRARQLIDGALPMIDRGLLIYHRNLEDEEA